LLLTGGLLASGCSQEKTAEAPSTPPGGPPAGTAAAPAASTATPGSEPKKAAGKPEKVVTLPSGLKYVDLVVGKGASPKSGQKVVVQYVGTLADGTKFDSSYDHGAPFDFVLGQHAVIQGWDEGVATMKPGGKRKLICPPDLAYGPNGNPPVIPPNATLTFVVELLRVE
jgi:peptidylprolyl isomerase